MGEAIPAAQDKGQKFLTKTEKTGARNFHGKQSIFIPHDGGEGGIG